MDYPDDLQLWPHQAEAIDTVSPFLDVQLGPRTEGRPSALVNIPTGGGKTAVIGTLANWHPGLGRVLVLAPRTAIRDQLAKELSAERGFFLRLGYRADTMPKGVQVLKSARDLPAQLPERTIFVSTIQLVDDMASTPARREGYERLGDGCDAVVVDEGHYEPARSWSQTIRGLGQPTVLVTATPYRNDLKAFEFDHEAVYISRYSDLMNAHSRAILSNRTPRLSGFTSTSCSKEWTVQAFGRSRSLVCSARQGRWSSRSGGSSGTRYKMRPSRRF